MWRATEHCSLERAWQYHETEIAWEIAEANADDLPADWTEDEGVEEEVWTILDDAATIAIDEARRTFGERPLIEVLS